MPLLGAVRRDRSTLCGGFSFRVRLRPRMIVADESPGQRLALATPMSLVVRTRHRSWVTGSEPDPVHYAGALGHTFMALLRGALLHGRGVPEARSRPTVAPFEQRRR